MVQTNDVVILNDESVPFADKLTSLHASIFLEAELLHISNICSSETGFLAVVYFLDHTEHEWMSDTFLWLKCNAKCS